MNPIDARELSGTTSLSTDICIIGAGAAGMSLASEFLHSSHDVCLIESGAYKPELETQSLYDLESVGYPTRRNFMARARYLGGTSNIWAGRTMKLEPIDFRRREWVPDSGWPIEPADLDPYYVRAERILGLPSFSRFSGSLHELPGLSSTESELLQDDTLRPKVVIWGRSPLRFQKTFKKALSGSPKIRIYVNANVTEIVTDEAGDRVREVVALTLNGNQLRIAARVFVLACGGLENPRLLLVSRRRHPNGIGNHHDLVGRFFMEHPRAIFGRVHLSVPFKSSLLLGSPLPDGRLQIGIGFSEELQRRERLLNNYLTIEPQLSQIAEQGYQSSVNVMKMLLRKGYAGSRFDIFRISLPEIRDMVYLLTPKEIMPHWIYRHYAQLKRLARKYRTIQELTVINYCEQMPRRESRVYLGEARDRLGMNSLVLDWRIGDEETANLLRLQELFGKWIAERGIGILESSLPETGLPPYTDASHHMGTTRMSDDPKRGVVDRNARVHDVDNLFIAGSSVFPTAGHANPTLTIVALAIRLADHLKTLVK